MTSPSKKPGISGRPDVMIFGLRHVFGTQGGIETHVRSLTDQLGRLGLSVEVVTRSLYSHGAEPSVHGNVVLTSIWAPRSSSGETLVHSFLAVLYAIYRRPRLLHIHAIGPALMTPVARLFGLRVVVTHHGQDYLRERWGTVARWLLRTGEYLTAKFANECIVVSRPVAQGLERRYHRPFRYIPNGVSLATDLAQPEILTRFGLKPKRYVLNVGRIVKEKRQADLIAAFRALRDPDIKLVIVGKADHDSDFARDLALSVQGDDRIVLAGFQQGAALQTLFREAMVFALPSSHEGLAIAALEAMSFGRPILISDIAANLALDLPAECYVKTGDLHAWTEALRELISSHSRQPPTVDWTPYIQRYNWHDIALRTLGVYRSASDDLDRFSEVLPVSSNKG